MGSNLRPVIIKFVNLTIKMLVMRNLFKLKTMNEPYAKIRVGHDLTRDQRDQLKKLVDEAREKENSTEGDFLYRVRGAVGRWKITKFPKKISV